MTAVEDVKIPKSIWALGFVSFFIKSSTVVLITLTPLFITGTMGVSKTVLGMLEGLVELFSLATRMLSGVVSDYISKRKIVIALGYVVALISRPILALAPSVEVVFLGRSLDRIGNGLDATPRDALVGDLAPKEIKGSCYGLRQSLGTAGAIFGSLFAGFLMWYTYNDYHTVFWITSIPIFLALLLLITMVKDPVSEKPAQEKRERKSPQEFFQELSLLTRPYWKVILLSFVFMLSNYGGAWLVLSLENQGVDDSWIPAGMVVQNIATSLAAYPVGYLSDKINRRALLLIGILIVVLSNIALASAIILETGSTFLFLSASLWMVILGIFFWGAQLGFTQSLLAAMVADTCPDSLRGTAFGVFHLLNGVAYLIGNTVVGYLWENESPTYGFAFSAFAATVAFALLFSYRKKR